MARDAVDQLLYLLDRAFDGREWHSLLGNLRAVTEADWRWVPRHGHRSIRDIVQHVGGCKLMYEDHASGAATLWWDDPAVGGGDALATRASAIEWLRESHDCFRRRVAALDDAGLSRPRLTNWGELKETRWIVATMIEHDLYHAGEINHLRSLSQRSDRWAYGDGA